MCISGHHVTASHPHDQADPDRPRQICTTLHALQYVRASQLPRAAPTDSLNSLPDTIEPLANPIPGMPFETNFKSTPNHSKPRSVLFPTPPLSGATPAAPPHSSPSGVLPLPPPPHPPNCAARALYSLRAAAKLLPKEDLASCLRVKMTQCNVTCERARRHNYSHTPRVCVCVC